MSLLVQKVIVEDRFRDLNILKAGKIIEWVFSILRRTIQKGKAVGIITARDDAKLIQQFLAHNGTSFDHKIMYNYGLFKNVNKWQLLDSKYILRLINLSGNNTLKHLYDLIVNQDDITDYHRADIDVYMLKKILEKINFCI